MPLTDAPQPRLDVYQPRLLMSITIGAVTENYGNEEILVLDGVWGGGYAFEYGGEGTKEWGDTYEFEYGDR